MSALLQAPGNGGTEQGSSCEPDNREETMMGTGASSLGDSDGGTPDGPNMANPHARECQYGGAIRRCAETATATRPGPGSEGAWAVCDEHAEALDRLRRQVEDNRRVIDRLADL